MKEEKRKVNEGRETEGKGRNGGWGGRKREKKIEGETYGKKRMRDWRQNGIGKRKTRGNWGKRHRGKIKRRKTEEGMQEDERQRWKRNGEKGIEEQK